MLLDRIERNVVARLAPQTLGERSAADFGTGTGRFALELMRLGFRVTASDASLAMLLATRRKAREDTPDRLDLVRGDIYGLPMKAESFSFVVCIHVLSQLGHIEHQMEAVRELVRVCAPGGRVVFDAYNRNSLAMLAPSAKTGLVSLSALERRLVEMGDVRVDRIIGRFIVPLTFFRLVPKSWHRKLDHLDEIASSKASRFATKSYYCLVKCKR